MPSTRTFYKTIVTAIIVSEEQPPDDMTVAQMVRETEEGDYSGSFYADRYPITAVEAAELLVDQGSEPGFFMLTETGEDVEPDHQAETQAQPEQIRRLTCCCCGASTRGRQWHNRDTGFGLCGSCALWIRGRGKTTPEEFDRCYGIEGVHFNVVEVAAP